MKRTLTIENTTKSAVMETLEQFFSLDFQNTRDWPGSSFARVPVFYSPECVE